MVLSSEIESRKNAIALLETGNRNDLSKDDEVISTSEDLVQEDVLSKSNSSKEDNFKLLFEDSLVSFNLSSLSDSLNFS